MKRAVAIVVLSLCSVNAWALWGGFGGLTGGGLVNDVVLLWSNSTTNDPTADGGRFATNTGTLGTGGNFPPHVSSTNGMSAYRTGDAGDFIRKASPAGFTNASGAVSAWALLDSTTTNDVVLWSVSRAAGATRSDISVWRDGSDDKMYAACLVDGVVTWSFSTTNAVEANMFGIWTLVTLSQDGVVPKLFVNFTEQTLYWLTTTDQTLWFPAVFGATDPADGFTAGALARNGSPVNGWIGGWDENTVYDAPRTAADVTNDYWAGYVGHGGVQWDVDNRSDWDDAVYIGNGNYPSYADTGPLGNHGTAGSGIAAADVVNVKTNNGTWDYDGNDYGTLPASSSLSPGAGNFAFSLWFWLNHASGTGMLMYWDYGADTDNLIYIGLTATDRYIDVLFRDGDGNVAAFTGTNGYDNVGWQHLLVQRVGTTVEVWVDAVLQGVGTNAALGTITVGDGALPFIGASSTPGSFAWGYIDDLRLYQKSFSGTSITNHYEVNTNLYL